MVVLTRAGVVQTAWQPLSRYLVWGVVAYCAVGALANTVTPSASERMVWLPVTLLLLGTSLLVAIGP